ncbi:TPA: MobQ family relaxase, partial [Streptococcus pneumoniae]
MADSFHFSVNIISRGKGKSAVASAAYISGEKIKNEWDGVTHDYTRKEKILVKNIILPDHIPKEFNDRSTLWNKVEMAEKNSNAQLARQFIIGLPKELSLSENKNLVERYIKENLTSQGMIVDYAIHDESQDKNGNIHCHIMTIMRPINEKGEFLAKSKKEYILDPQLFTPNLKTIQNPCLSLDPGWFLFSPNGCFLLDKKEFPLYGISVEKNTKRK